MITDKSAFEDAQSLARIAYFADKNGARWFFWDAAMKALKEAYGVKS